MSGATDAFDVWSAYVMSGATDEAGHMPTPLQAIASEQVDAIYVTGALRDGHWLHHREACFHFDDRVVLFVADNIADEAKRLWPAASVHEPVGVR